MFYIVTFSRVHPVYIFTSPHQICCAGQDKTSRQQGYSWADIRDHLKSAYKKAERAFQIFWFLRDFRPTLFSSEPPSIIYTTSFKVATVNIFILAMTPKTTCMSGWSLIVMTRQRFITQLCGSPQLHTCFIVSFSLLLFFPAHTFTVLVQSYRSH